ncbi:hypothetical protein AWC17_08280 [Mycobacterium nebraskense]|uniref:Uncharacterized protein n=1 Tax=Mycobacterium nebraskense TaxID=244292 RepID=A0A0F5NAZ9_9MYCO|nr:hypothetical protein WU83_15045 [Mycobacterium nebraskense]KLO36052.1 hypothetical protein ABW17_23115 [Mycobacterium nebraskense]ORW20259.1 hypothetical protein AWC17_08280 [Mycobacterium nebraskense]
MIRRRSYNYTEGVIANVGFFGLPLLLNLFHPAAPRGGISWGFGEHGLLTNLGVTTVGNLIALPFWSSRSYSDAASSRRLTIALPRP